MQSSDALSDKMESEQSLVRNVHRVLVRVARLVTAVFYGIINKLSGPQTMHMLIVKYS